MGGRAFRALLGASTVFSRLAPDVDHKLRASGIEDLQRQFNFIGVPPEDPGKLEFGDLDIIQ